MSQNKDLSYLLQATEHFIQKFRYPVDLAFWSELHNCKYFLLLYCLQKLFFLAYHMHSNFRESKLYSAEICLHKSKGISTLYLSRLEAFSILKRLFFVDLLSGLCEKTKIANCGCRYRGFCMQNRLKM